MEKTKAAEGEFRTEGKRTKLIQYYNNSSSNTFNDERGLLQRDRKNPGGTLDVQKRASEAWKPRLIEKCKKCDSFDLRLDHIMSCRFW